MRRPAVLPATESEIGAPLPADDPAGRATLVHHLDRLGLRSSARLLLDSLQPVSWLGAQALWLAQPVGALVGAGDRVAHWARTLESDTEYVALLAALDPTPPEDAV
jgi:hypothetical protein